MVYVLVCLLIVGIFFNVYRNLSYAAKQKVEKARTKGEEEQCNFPPDIIDLYNKGYNYQTGYGPTGIKSLEKAIEFYTLAANKGYPAACYRLGQIYSSGTDVPLDLNLARKYVTKACARDYPGADELYKIISQKLEIVQKEQQLKEQKLK